MCNKWDLDGLIDLNNVPLLTTMLEEDLKNIYEFLYPVYKKHYKKSLFKVFKNKKSIEGFTTSEEFYKLTGIYELQVAPRTVLFETSTDVLIYLYPSFKYRLEYCILDGFPGIIWITHLGDIDKNHTLLKKVDKEVLLKIINKNFIFYLAEGITKEDILNHFGLCEQGRQV